MITRETQKKLINVSIITLKKYSKKYELAVYPNKIYEYRHDNSVPLDSILHTNKIYKNLATGDTASEQDLACFNMSHINIVRYILDNGYEQKAQATSDYELAAIEKQIVNLIQGKVTYHSSYVSDEKLISYIKNVYTIKNTSAKKQVSKIIKELEKIGFERICFKVVSELNTNDVDNLLKLIEKNNDLTSSNLNISNDLWIRPCCGYILVKSDVLPLVVNYCNERKIKYLILQNEEVEEEEIC